MPVRRANHPVRATLTAIAVAVGVSAACGGSPNPPSPGTPGPGTGETITGRERIGWLQPAVDADQLATLAYAAYVDGGRRVLEGATCPTSNDAGFECSAPLPSMTPGPHTIELVSFAISGDTVLESERSSPIRVTVAAITSSSVPSATATAALVTSDGHRVQASVVAANLHDPSDLAVAPDGRVFIAERRGRVRIVGPAGSTEALDLDDVLASDESGLTALTLHPEFDRNGYVYVAYASDTRESAVIRVARFRERNGVLAEAATIARERLPSAGHVAARFGTDGKLYVGMGAGNDPREAERAASPIGKILRLNEDGTSPRDNPRASTIFSSGHREPRAFAWQATGAMWELERDSDAVDELNAVVAGADYGWPPGGTSPAGSRSVPAALVFAPGTEVSGASFVPRDSGSPFAGELLVGSLGANDLLRVHVDDRGRPRLAEGILQGHYGRISAVAVSSDGAIYATTANRDTWGDGRDVLIRVVAAPRR